MPDSQWHWVSGSVYGECERCGEPLWDGQQLLVTCRDRNFHLRCLQETPITPIAGAAPSSHREY